MIDYTRIFPRQTARLASPDLLPGACVTPDERAAAEEACRAEQIRGLSGLGQVSRDEHYRGRFADVEPCVVRTLPTCPCISEQDVEPIAACIAGVTPNGWSPAYHDQWCAEVGAGVMTNIWCPGSAVPPVPPCIEPGDVQHVSYCGQYGFGGPNPLLNALCWGAIKSGILPDIMNLPVCQAAPPPPYQQPPPPPPPPPTTTTPTSVPTEPPEETTEPRTERSAMLLPGLILLLVLGGGTAYYLAQRRK